MRTGIRRRRWPFGGKDMIPDKIRDFAEPVHWTNPEGLSREYMGAPLEKLLPNLKDDELVEFTGSDERILALSGEEIKAGGVYLVEEGGVLRLVILTDRHRRRWCKNIVDIKRKRKN